MTDAPLLLLPAEKENLPAREVPLEERFRVELDLLKRYANEVTFNGRDIAHPVRVAALVSDFSNGQMNDGVFTAALLHDMAQTAWPQQEHVDDDYAATKNARRLLKEFSTSDYANEVITPPSSPVPLTRWQYVSGLLANLNITEQYAEVSRKSEAPGKSPEALAVLKGHSIGKVSPRSLWLEPGAITPPTEIQNLLAVEGGQGVDLEAAFIKAAEKLDALMFPPENERSMLRNIHDAESFYAPLCEYISKDGLASALRSWASITRLKMSGHVAFVEKAQEMIDALGDRETSLRSTEKFLGRLALGDVDVDHAFRDTTGHGITLGTAEIGVKRSISQTKEHTYARAVWRIKSVGSLAMKLLGDHSDLLWAPIDQQRERLAETTALPADLHGMAIIAKEHSALAQLFSEAALNITDDPDISFIAPPSRLESGKAIHIKGGADFVQKMVGALTLHCKNITEDGNPKIGLKDIDIPPKQSAYQVAKITGEYDGRRIEVQFQTDRDRMDGRIGLSAHALYKLKEQLKQYACAGYEEMIANLTKASVKAMAAIHERAEDLGTYELAQPYGYRQQRFRKHIASFSTGILGWRAYVEKKPKSRP